MSKNIENRNFTTIYIRSEYREIFAEFIKYANKDSNFIAKRYKAKDSLVSIGILTLIARYVKAKQETEGVEAGEAK